MTTSGVGKRRFRFIRRESDVQTSLTLLATAAWASPVLTVVGLTLLDNETAYDILNLPSLLEGLVQDATSEAARLVKALCPTEPNFVELSEVKRRTLCPETLEVSTLPILGGVQTIETADAFTSVLSFNLLDLSPL